MSLHTCRVTQYTTVLGGHLRDMVYMPNMSVCYGAYGDILTWTGNNLSYELDISNYVNPTRFKGYRATPMWVVIKEFNH